MSVWNQEAKKKGDGDYPKAPPGNHPAVLVAIVDLGHQENNYQGNVTVQRQAYFCWELVNEKQPNSNANFLIGNSLTVSLNEKAKLRKWIQSRIGRTIADGEKYDIRQELGQPCLLNVIEKNGYPQIDNVGPLPRGMACPPPKNAPFLWSMENMPADRKINLPAWLPWSYGSPLGAIIMGSYEMTGKTIPERNSQTDNTPTSPPNGFAPSPSIAAQQAVAAQVAQPTSASGPPLRKPRAVSPPPPVATVPMYWCVGATDTDPKKVTEHEIRDMVRNGASPHDLDVCPDGGQEYRPASEVFPGISATPTF
jgi:hypothetical protein